VFNHHQLSKPSVVVCHVTTTATAKHARACVCIMACMKVQTIGTDSLPACEGPWQWRVHSSQHPQKACHGTSAVSLQVSLAPPCAQHLPPLEGDSSDPCGRPASQNKTSEAMWKARVELLQNQSAAAMQCRTHDYKVVAQQTLSHYIFAPLATQQHAWF